MAEMTDERLRVETADGKYTVIQNADGTAQALRYGKSWRELTDDNLVLSLAYDLRSAREDIEQLSRLVYVPGLWRYPKCDFQLVQANLNAADGSVTARNEPGDKCPNCNSPLWRVTERQAGNDMVDRYEEQIEARKVAEAERDRLRGTALGLALKMLFPHEPPDSRAVSPEFVALSAVHCGIADEASWAVIDAALSTKEPQQCNFGK